MNKRIPALIIAFAMAFSVIGYVCTDSSQAASKGTYWLKVNKKCNVVNVYKKVDGKWKPYRAMLCSCGKNGSTPKGTYSVKVKYTWRLLYGNVYGQYATRFYGHYLFHSVYYKTKGTKSTLLVKEYNKLGTACSKGCVRLCVMDAKWIYENCPKGTKVTVYSSSDPGPLGKPQGFKLKGKYAWDPTDPSKSNPNFKMTGPVITIKNKAKTVEYGKKFTVKKGVTAKNPYALQDLTSKIKVKIYKYNTDKEKYVSLDTTKINTKKPGKYKIVYSCYDKYCGKKTVKKKFYVTVKDKPEPVPPEPADEEDNTNNSETENTQDETPASEGTEQL